MHQFRVFHANGDEVLGLTFIILGFTPNAVGSEHQVRHFAVAHPLLELRIGDFLALGFGQITLQPGDEKQGDHKVPERKMDFLLGGIGCA